MAWSLLAASLRSSAAKAAVTGESSSLQWWNVGKTGSGLSGSNGGAGLMTTALVVTPPVVPGRHRIRLIKPKPREKCSVWVLGSALIGTLFGDVCTSALYWFFRKSRIDF